MKNASAIGIGVGLTTRGLWQRRWLSLVVFLTASVAVAAAAVGPMYTEAARTAIVRDAFALAPADAQGIMFVWDRPYQTPPAFLDETPNATGIPHVFDSPIRAAELTSDILDETGRIRLVWREGVCSRLVMVSGRCPSSSGEVVASDVTSQRYGWAIGSQVSLRALAPISSVGADESAEEPLSLTVVGIYEPRDPDERFWFGGQFFPHSTATSEGNVAAGLPVDPLFTDESTLAWSASAGALWEVSATILVDLESLEGGDARSLQAATPRAREWAADRVAEWQGTRAIVFTDMQGVAANAIREQESLGVSVVIVSLELVALIWLLLFLAVNDLIRARRSEIGLARLRGLSRLQVWRFGLAEPVTLLLLALPVGVLLSEPIVRMLSGWLLGTSLEVSPGSQVWWAAIAAILGGLLAAALAARSTLTVPVIEQWRNPRADTAGRSWVVDAVVITLVAAGLVELMSGGLITESSEQTMTALLVPALIATACALLVARIVPYFARLTYQVTDRGRGIGPFIGLRHASRSADTTSMLIVLTVAFSLAAFALTAWAVTVRNHRNVAMVHNGAPAVLFVTPPEGTSLIDLVDEADPGGQSAVPVAVYDRTARLLVADTERLQHVANWQPEFTEAQFAELLPLLRPPSAPQVFVSGDEIRLTADTRLSTPPGLEVYADLEIPGQFGRVGLPLQISEQADSHLIVGGRLPSECREACELRGISVVTSVGADGGTFRAELVINQIEIRSAAGWQAIDVGLTLAEGWRAEGSSFRIPAEATAAQDGLVLTFETGELVQVVVATYPPALPAITLGDIGPRPAGTPVGGLDGGVQDVETVSETGVLPGATGPTALVDYEVAQRSAFGLVSHIEHQVWTTSEAAPTVKQALQDQGVLITAERTVSDLERQFNSEGPGLALALLLVMAAAGALLAMARAAINLYASGRQRSHQFAVLSAIGVTPQAQRAAILIEQSVTIGAGVIAGAVAGVIASAIALQRIPQFTTPPATPPLTFTPDPIVIAGALLVSALSVIVVVVLTTETIRRTVGPDQLRRAAP